MKDHPGAPRPPTIGNYGTTGNYGYQAEAPVGVTDYPIKNVPFIDADYGFSTDNIFFNGRLSPVQWEQMQYADATHQFQESFSPAGMGHSMANFYRSIEDIARRTGMHPHTSPIYGPENYRDFIHRVRVHVGRR